MLNSLNEGFCRSVSCSSAVVAGSTLLCSEKQHTVKVLCFWFWFWMPTRLCSGNPSVLTRCLRVWWSSGRWKRAHRSGRREPIFSQNISMLNNQFNHCSHFYSFRFRFCLHSEVNRMNEYYIFHLLFIDLVLCFIRIYITKLFTQEDTTFHLEILFFLLQTFQYVHV